ncbi:MAG TPA: hypothetical protein PKX48_09310 [Planctomycetota bacterium]|mgnify:CR=1 FL=1|jgi:hypothetical protein|nr:hypothetical protein [Planctomycetota bacterium]OQC20984.1 MAG: hypothetical protein BWX69_01394 [Planctomycetes bacterium ADurb.Bin069]NMD34582.1 hypothetical protein [Planctomycetota bacterium]HNR98478.1 hypothetical protein [Planctomycetota bacterium]HNU25102.1 hypothetical protein [Planctomycetota bacterium]
MLKTVTAPLVVERQPVSGLCDRIEAILRDHDKAGARALLPELRALRERVARLRGLSPDFAELGLGPFVIAAAELAGRGEEFAAFA